jgi:hypothetical protein
MILIFMKQGEQVSRRPAELTEKTDPKISGKMTELYVIEFPDTGIFCIDSKAEQSPLMQLL